MAEVDIDKLSDEELQNMAPPEIKEEDEVETTTPELEVTDSVEEQETPTDPEQITDEQPEKTDETNSEKDPEQKEDTKQQQQTAYDYEGFYKQIMAPIKANGKTFQPRSPEEAIRLMQMGANYTQKMQGIAPYRKTIQMLKNANLLDDGKLNFLVDVSQGNPEAIKKLLKDSKLDPLDMNIDDEPKYVPGNHTPSDNEVRVQTVVDDLKSTPEGVETLKAIQGMDQASMNEIWNEPSLMTTLNEQRQSGVYDLITKEIEHQRMIGNIPEGTSFLDAYKSVGNYLLQVQQAQLQQAQQQQMLKNLPQGTLNKSVQNNSQVKSAAPSGRSAKSAQQFVDPFSLSEEEFNKTFKDYGF